jgi:flagellar hook-associated protein 2
MATSSTAMNAMTTLRMSGLASGMDTESMVTSLMKVERLKYDKMAQQKTKMDWKSDANLNVNNLLRTFRDTYLSITKPDTYMLSPASILMNKVTMDASSSVKITANKDAFSGSHQIDSITSLASGATAASGAAISTTAPSADTLLGATALGLVNPLDFTDGGAISFAINGETFSFSATDSLQTLLNRVNSDSKANVSMSYSSLTGKISITNKAQGSDSSLVIQNLKGNAFSATNSALGIAEGTFANGTDAVLKIDGTSVTKKTNSFTIDGISYKLTGTTGTPVKFSVEQDIDGAVDKIKGFVTAYNTLIGSLDDIVNEKKNPDYAPLTDDQKSSMSETQIDQWEKLAKSGMLSGDSYINKLTQDMRQGFYDKVAGAGSNAASIGLGTISYLTKGAIYVDETKLRQALQDNPQKVAEILTDTSSATSFATKNSESGLAVRMQDQINRYINDAQGYRQTSANAQYSRLTDDMTRMQQTLQDKEDRYWAQFTAMETALSKMNSQSSWLSQQLSSSQS